MNVKILYLLYVIFLIYALVIWDAAAVDVAIPDPNLEAALRDALEKPSGTITDEDLAGLTKLVAEHKGIVDLTGLEYCSNLFHLNLNDNVISDISPLGNMTILQYLTIWKNQISDISPLANLTDLERLDFGWGGGNQISDISPLAGLTKLTLLNLNDNLISDIGPLANLTNLTFLSIWKNQISDISPLANLTDLEHLDLGWGGGNQISDVGPLSDLTKLNYLNLNDNLISDISPLANLINLVTLILNHNQISDISILASLPELKELHAQVNQISDISPLSNLTKLISLNLSLNEVNDINPLVNLTNLQDLNLGHNQVSDIHALANLTNMIELRLYDNQISDISVLANLVRLTTIELWGNQIIDISVLSDLDYLTELSIRNNSIDDITALASNPGLGSGDEVDLRGNFLNNEAYTTHIPALQTRGVNVIFDPSSSILLIKGDVNGDDVVKSNDAIITLRIAAGLMTSTSEQEYAADMNDDGLVKANDAILILRKVAGLAAPGMAALTDTGREATLMLAEAHGTAGERISVPLEIDCARGVVAGGDICIAYDSAVLRAVDVSSASDILLVSNTAGLGVLHIAFADVSGLNKRLVAEIQFDILVDHVSPMTFRTVELYDHGAYPIDVSKLDGQFSSWAIAPEHSALLQNFPNPFNPDTWIPYQLREGSEVAIRIYGIAGDLVRELDLGYTPAGLYVSSDRAAHWDGRNASGERVASGIYFYTIQADKYSATQKMILSK